MNNIQLSQQSILKDIATQYNDPNISILNTDILIAGVGMHLGEQQDPRDFIELLSESFAHIQNTF